MRYTNLPTSLSAAKPSQIPGLFIHRARSAALLGAVLIGAALWIKEPGWLKFLELAFAEQIVVGWLIVQVCTAFGAGGLFLLLGHAHDGYPGPWTRFLVLRPAEHSFNILANLAGLLTSAVGWLLLLGEFAHALRFGIAVYSTAMLAGLIWHVVRLTDANSPERRSQARWAEATMGVVWLVGAVWILSIGVEFAATLQT